VLLALQEEDLHQDLTAMILDQLSAAAKDKIGSLKSLVIRRANGALPFDYIVPNGVYEEQWDWDAFFVGLHLISVNKADGIYLKNWCLNFLRFTEPDGQTPGGVRPWAGRDARLYHIKPLMGQAAYYGSLSLGDFGWAAPVWEKMKSCVTYRERLMADPATNLVKWWDSMESGADNNPALIRRYHNSVAGADVNAFMVLDYRAMALIAERIGRREDALAFRGKARRLSEMVNAHLWDAADSTYYNYDGVEKARIPCITYSNQVPLWAGLASREQARAMIERYVLEPGKLWSPNGIRSLAKDEPLYNNENVIKPYSNWQGPIWPHANWMIMHALIRYGYPDAALETAEKVTRLCLDDLTQNGMMHENYHADTGRPLAVPDFISWNLLVSQMIEEARSGRFLPDPGQSLWAD
jgi:alpha,alpha-trehalase